MAKSDEISTIVQISAPSGHTIMSAGQAAARGKIGAYVAALLQGLGVPGAPAMRWQQQPAGSKVVEVSINETPARLRYTTANSLGASPVAFAAALCEDILRNRALFVGSPLVRYAASIAHASFREMEEAAQEKIVQTLFVQGFGLQRLAQFAPPEAADKTPDAWAEACIGSLEAARFMLYGHPGQIDPDDNPLDFNRLIESAHYFVDVAFKVKGVPFPKMQGIKRADFVANEVALQVNDLLFPAFTVGDSSADNLRFVGFLTGNSAFFLNRGAVDYLLESIETTHPNLLALARSRFTTDFITAVLRHLAAESISVRPLVRILEILVSGGQDVYPQQPGVSEAPPLSETIHLVAGSKGPENLDAADWAEFVRLHLKNAIINRALLHFEEPQALSCFFLQDSLLEKIDRYESLPAAEQAALRQALHRQIAEGYLTPAGKIRPVVTSAAWRKKVSDLIAFEFPETPVFSLQECLPRIVVRFDSMIAE